MALSLVVLAAGLGRRYGGAKQLEAVGPGGETLMELAVYDAVAAGFTRVVMVVRPDVGDVLRDRVRGRLPGTLSVAFVEQRLDDLPRGVRPAPGRVRPWGTGHAVLAAESAVDGPFAVCNADDYYGASSFSLVAGCLTSLPPPPPPRHCVVGYRLDATLSEHGGVSRALCDVADDDRVVEIREVMDVRRTREGIFGRAGGAAVSLTGAEMVSMNLWGFAAPVFESLKGLFLAFLDRQGTDAESEFLLPEAVGEMLAARTAEVRLVRARERWTGLTHPPDRDRVVRRIRGLVRRGAYPTPLFPIAER